jgi:rod shape determining protein RodA
MTSRLREIDRPLVGVVAALIAFGLATLYSAGRTEAPTFVNQIWQRQLVWLVLGIGCAWLVFRTSPRVLEWATPLVYGAAIVLLLLTLVVGTGAGTAASSRSWIAIGGVRLGQPAEFVKVAVVLMLGRWLADRPAPPANLRELVPAALLAGIPAALVFLQPDLGSALVFVGIFFAMQFWAGTRAWLLFLLASPAVGLILAFSTLAWGAWILVLFGLLIWWRPYVWEGLAVMLVNVACGAVALPLWQRLAPYQQNRLLAFLNPEIVDPRAAGWHVIQSKVAIGSGGLFGRGFAEGSQKALGFLPAQHTDFIFSVVGEEQGFLGVVVAVTLFCALVLILMRVARRATDPYSSLCVFGIAALFFIHIVENIGMTVNLMPITGIPLPFFSYGGSFLLTCLLSIGIVLRVAWESRQSGYAQL